MVESIKIWEEIGPGLEEAVRNITRKDIQKRLVDPARIRKVIRDQQVSGVIDGTLAEELMGYLSFLTSKRKKK